MITNPLTPIPPQVSLHRNPCVRLSGDPNAPRAPNRRSFAAHASAALDCCWASAGGAGGAGGGEGGGELVLSVGGYDLALMQWTARRLEASATPMSASSADVAPPTPAELRERRRARKLQASRSSGSVSG